MLSHRSRLSLASALALILGGCSAGPVDEPEMLPAPSAAPVALDLAVPDGPATLQIRGVPRQGGLVRGIVPIGTTDLTLDDKPVEFDREGNFIIAFDRDAKRNSVLTATLVTGKPQTRMIAVAAGKWAIQNVNASITGGVSSEAFQQQRAGELARIEAARSLRPLSDGWRQGFIWPVRARISGVFGSQRIYRGTPGSYHSGLDLAGGAGTVYVAPADGVVVLASESPFSLEGKLLIIDHGMGLNSAFLHNERLLVKEGDSVKQGQPIGHIGATGRATGPHLHWSMKWNDARIDPLLLLSEPARR